MKRCFICIINFFTQFVIRIGIEEIGAIIIGIVVGISVFNYIDIVPATADDYEIMEKQMTDIQQNPNLLFKTNCKISINGDVITVILKNNECTMTAQYDQNFEILSTSKNDNYIFWPFALGIAIFMGVFTYAAAFFLLKIIVLFLEIFVGINIK